MAAIARRWPLYHDQLVTQAPIRGCCPLRCLTGVGVLDLYVNHPGNLAGIDQDQVAAVAGVIAHRLTAGPMFPDFRNAPPWDGPLWLDNPQAGARGNVLMAMGMLSVALGLRMDDALAALRAHAFAPARTVDATASDIVHPAPSPATGAGRRQHHVKTTAAEPVRGRRCASRSHH